MYIRATGNISPQKTFGHPAFPTEPIEYSGSRLACVEPDYKNIIDAKLIRRMSRIIRMGVAAAMECLKEAEVKTPDAIITGTAYGCLDDTGLFLTKMVEFNEELLTPTAFIQSTHNTIGAQIGLMLSCNNYNNTFVHRGFSFESALLDGMMLLQEKEVANVLVGAVDEITNISHTILNRLGLYKQGPVSNLDLFTTKSKGTIAGEGAAFFLLANEPSATDYAKLDAIETIYKPEGVKEIEERILSLLALHYISIEDIDLVITGKNGDTQSDKIFDRLNQGIFSEKKSINYKNLCGEYPTSTGFALWMAANIIKSGAVPGDFDNTGSNLTRSNHSGPNHSGPNHDGSKETPVRRILIYNHYQGIHHSLLLISAC